jgi:hypothetical protein
MVDATSARAHFFCAERNVVPAPGPAQRVPACNVGYVRARQPLLDRANALTPLDAPHAAS